MTSHVLPTYNRAPLSFERAKAPGSWRRTGSDIWTSARASR